MQPSPRRRIEGECFVAERRREGAPDPQRVLPLVRDEPAPGGGGGEQVGDDRALAQFFQRRQPEDACFHHGRGSDDEAERAQVRRAEAAVRQVGEGLVDERLEVLTNAGTETVVEVHDGGDRGRAGERLRGRWLADCAIRPASALGAFWPLLGGSGRLWGESRHRLDPG
ncbi:hypothetical protein [Nannocystis pusilla]|uniref:hypothetical protein n=1 Tax=Nannocystis pusilla TaxID=889268 RepID=UPI003BF5C50A